MHVSPQPAQPGISKTRRLLGRAPRTRSVVAATGLLVICVAPFASARTGGPLREGVRNGTTTSETQVISNIGSAPGPTGGYSTRQSNLSNSGGGAVYGCRSQVGGSAAKPRPQNPCLRANNLNTGYAFEFNASDGPIAGLISAGAGGDSKKPFVTNATGIATGLNADRVDGLDAAAIIAAARAKAGMDADTVDGANASDLKVRWALVDESGDIIEQSGGFTLTSKPGINGQPATNPNIYISAGSSLVDKGLNATIAIQNRLDRDGIAGTDPGFGGDVAVARCNTAAVACAPTDTNNDNTLVVRSLVNNADAASQTRRFYVEVTE